MTQKMKLLALFTEGIMLLRKCCSLQTGHARRDLGPDQAVVTGTGAQGVEKDTRSGGDLVVRVRKKGERKQVVSQERENKKERKNENDQRVAHLTVHPQVEVGVAALVIRKKTKTFSVSVDLVAKAMKKKLGKTDLAVRKKTEFVTKTEKDDQEAATGQVLQVRDQKVKVQIRNKENLKAGW